jgi:hypothetical protein
LDLFDGRALKTHSSHATPAIVAALNNSPIGRGYNAILPERSVLVYQCDKGFLLCDDKTYGFAAMIMEAAKIANSAHPSPEPLAQGWLASAGAQDNVFRSEVTFSTLASAPFQLLAISNRMEHAHLGSGRWSGAQIHFVYGLVPSNNAKPKNLTVILEFGLRDFLAADFAALAAEWGKLSTVADRAYSGQLQTALKRSGFALDPSGRTSLLRVRSRIDHEVGPWRLSQLLLDPTSPDPSFHTKFAQAPLDDQLVTDAARNAADYMLLWGRVQSSLTPPSSIPRGSPPSPPVPASIQAPSVIDHRGSLTGMPIPQQACAGKDKTAVRDELAMQQCTWCHSTETNTTFQHVTNRPVKGASFLSGFLAGQHPENAHNLHPSMEDLYNGNRNVVWWASFNYDSFSPGRGGACNPEVVPVVRKFHDLARRALFLVAIQQKDTNGKIGADAGKFSTSFSQ